MKALILIICLFSISLFSFSQGDFNKQMATAKKSYSAGKLEDAHFALQQALQELDMMIGKEVLKLLPVQLDTLKYNMREDHVTANAGYLGTSITRSYGISNKNTLEIMSNSPIVASLNAYLNMPMMGGMMRDERTKVIKVQGYKARLEKESGDADNAYNLQIPFNNSLLTLRTKGINEDDIVRLINTFPLQEIAKLIQ